MRPTRGASTAASSGVALKQHSKLEARKELAELCARARAVAFDALKRVFAETGLVGHARTAALQVGCRGNSERVGNGTERIGYIVRVCPVAHSAWLRIMYACGACSPSLCAYGRSARARSTVRVMLHVACAPVALPLQELPRRMHAA
jgi:hypothetical protein